MARDGGFCLDSSWKLDQVGIRSRISHFLFRKKSQTAPTMFTFRICVIILAMMLSSWADKVEGGGTRALTEEEIMQLKSTGAFSKYNTLDGRDDEVDEDNQDEPVPTAVRGRKARCFFGSQGSDIKVPIQQWAIDPRLQYVRSPLSSQPVRYNPAPAQLQYYVT